MHLVSQRCDVQLIIYGDSARITKSLRYYHTGRFCYNIKRQCETTVLFVMIKVSQLFMFVREFCTQYQQIFPVIWTCQQIAQFYHDSIQDYRVQVSYLNGKLIFCFVQGNFSLRGHLG